jgi:hypothetical protein
MQWPDALERLVKINMYIHTPTMAQNGPPGVLINRKSVNHPLESRWKPGKSHIRDPISTSNKPLSGMPFFSGTAPACAEPNIPVPLAVGRIHGKMPNRKQ